jgi:hypothetical protein
LKLTQFTTCKQLTDMDPTKLLLSRPPRKGHIDVVRVLVDAGAWIYDKESHEIHGEKNFSKEGMSKRWRYYFMIFDVTLGGVWSSVPAAEFIRMMVDITSTDIQETALIKAAKAGHIDVFRAEVDAGADDRGGYGGSCCGGGGGGYGDSPRLPCIKGPGC